MKEYTEFDADKKIGRKLEYDQSGNVIKEVSYNIHGNPYRQFTYEYDEDGNKIKAYDHESILYHKQVFKYDDQGNEVEQANLDENGNITNKRTSSYDAQGNLIEVNHYHADERLDFRVSYQYEYDEQGNWTKKTKSYSTDTPTIILERIYQYYAE